MKKKEFNSITKSKTRIEAKTKADGEAIFGNDIEMKNMLYAYGVPSKYAFAKVNKIDTTEAENAQGVAAVITYRDLPGDKLMGEDKQDQYIFAIDRVITLGDVVALVVADTKENAKKAGKLVKVDYEPWDPITTPEKALETDMIVNPYKRDDNVCSSCFVKKGDTKTIFEDNENSVTCEFENTWQEHAYIEPEVVVAYPGDNNRGVTLIGSFQALYNSVVTIHKSLLLPMSDINVIAATVGGSFGGKLESTEVLAVRAAAAVLKTGRPVKYVLTREESMQQSHKRHPFKFKTKMSVDKNGYFTGFYASSFVDGGPYANMSPGVIFKAVSLGAGPYVIPNVYMDSKAMYTNNVTSGSMRGFGNPQGILARECTIDAIAEKLNISPYEIRKKNVMHRGDASGSGQIIDFEDIGAEEVLDAVAQKLDFEKKYKLYKNQDKTQTRRRGVGISLSYRGNSYGTGVPDIGRCFLDVKQDGSAVLSIGLTEIGQGLHTTMIQLAAEALGISDEKITLNESSSKCAPNTATCNASRGTFIGGNAILNAAKNIHECMSEALSEKYGCTKEEFEYYDNKVVWNNNVISFEKATEITYSSGRTPASQGTYKTPNPEFNEKTGFGDTFYEFTYSCIGAEVEVDICTGNIKVINVVSAHDVGRAINPKLAKGQIIGGAVMAQGCSLMENINSVNGKALNDNLDEYMIPNIMDIPENIEPVIVENPNDRGPFGARSLGEPTLDPGLGAFMNAVNNALGCTGHVTKLPMSPETILAGLFIE